MRDSYTVFFTYIPRSGKITSAVAEDVLRAYLTYVAGYSEDRWGNFHEPEPDRDGNPVRWHFKKQTVARQVKVGGRWVNRSSESLIEVACRAVRRSREKARRPEDIQRIDRFLKKCETKRKDKKRQAVRREFEDLQGWALKELVGQPGVWPIAYAFYVEGNREAGEALQAEIDTGTLFVIMDQLQAQGGPPPDDDAYTNLERPPLTPFRVETGSASEQLFYVEDYSVHFKNIARGEVLVTIGGGEANLTLDQRGRVQPVTWEARGSGHLVGTIRNATGPAGARQGDLTFTVTTAIGDWGALEVFTELVAAYGQDWFLASTDAGHDAYLERDGAFPVLGRLGHARAFGLPT